MCRSSSIPIFLAVFMAVSTAAVAQGYGDGPVPADNFGPPGGGPPPFTPGGGGPVGLPPPFILPPPCVHPIIIQVGRGLAHPARTKVIYGARPACG